MNQESQKYTKQAIEIFIRIALLVLVSFWCFEILSPFILPVMWGLIVAVAMYPVQKWLQPKLGNKQTLTAVLLTIVLLAILLVPASLFVASIANSIISLKDQILSGTLIIPSPNESIKQWPLIGNKVYEMLIMLTENTETVFQKYQTQILEVAKIILNGVVGTSLSILQILLSIIIAGVLLATKGTEEVLHKLLNRLMQDQGKEFVTLSASTIRSVVKGVLGVAVIQTTLVGFGLHFAGIPHAGIWILASLILTILQVGPGLVLIPVIFYLFGTLETTPAVLWTIYFVFVMLSDNIFKPILLGKGSPVPMLVIFLGVIGGFMLFGFIGLFTGAIILSIGYRILIAWLDSAELKTID